MLIADAQGQMPFHRTAHGDEPDGQGSPHSQVRRTKHGFNQRRRTYCRQARQPCGQEAARGRRSHYHQRRKGDLIRLEGHHLPRSTRRRTCGAAKSTARTSRRDRTQSSRGPSGACCRTRHSGARTRWHASRCTSVRRPSSTASRPSRWSRRACNRLSSYKYMQLGELSKLLGAKF